MGRLGNLSLGAAIIGLAVVTVMLHLSSCQEPVDELAPERNLGSIVMWRGGIENVRKFRDDTYMHPLSYYYFQANQPGMDRLISWLDLQKSEKVPQHLSQMAENAASRAGWQFAWANAQVYLAYYCDPLNADGTYWTTDMLLVSNGKGIYVTRGYHSAKATRTTDPWACAPQGWMPQQGNQRGASK